MGFSTVPVRIVDSLFCFFFSPGKYKKITPCERHAELVNWISVLSFVWLSGRVHVVLDLRLSQIITRTSSMCMRQVLDCVVFNSLSSVLDQILQYQINIILNNV